jgi:hypothetical protein
MRPGALSQTGFLGEAESLHKVLAHDSQALAELGVTCEELAARLDALLGAAETARSRTAYVGHHRIEVTVYTGFQMCPWSVDIHHGQCTAGGGVQHGSVDWRIRNLRSGQQMRGPGLIVHLIRDHRFFEGFGSPHRVDPTELARLLELGPFQT